MPTKAMPAPDMCMHGVLQCRPTEEALLACRLRQPGGGNCLARPKRVSSHQGSRLLELRLQQGGLLWQEGEPGKAAHPTQVLLRQ